MCVSKRVRKRLRANVIFVSVANICLAWDFIPPPLFFFRVEANVALSISDQANNFC